MSAPALTSGGGRVAAYDVGGTELFVLDGSGVLLNQTTEDPIVAANLNGSGMLALTTEASGTKGHVEVYSAAQQKAV